MSSLFKDYAEIARSGLFDPEYYISENPDVAALKCDPLKHYVELGASEMRNPSREFDAQSYVSRCHEKGEAAENPLLHYIKLNAIEEPQPPATEPEPESLIGLDLALIDSGAATGSRRITGEGWIVARQPITEVAVTIAQIRVIARYGLRRVDVAEAFPDYPRSEQSGFAFTLTGLPPEDTEGSLEFCFAVKTADGKTHKHSVQTYLSPAPEEDYSGASPAEQTYRGLPPLKMDIDACSVDPAGVLSLVGWAASFAQIVTVQVFIDNIRVGAAHHGQARKDVGLAYPDYPDSNLSGFTLKADINIFGAGRKILRVEAIASTGISRELLLPLDLTTAAERTVTPQGRSLDFFTDTIELTTDGWLAVEGWLVCPSETEEVIVELDGIPVGNAEIGRDRADVGNRFPSLPHARHSGFSFRQLTRPIAEGEHMIVLRVRAGGLETETPLPVLARKEQERRLFPEEERTKTSESLKLHVDLPVRVDGAMATPVRGNLEIAGWAVARNGVAGIEIAIDGEIRTTAHTGIRRMDVFSQFGGWDGALTSGFTALLPHRSLSVGSHVLSITMRDEAGNAAYTEFSIEVEEGPETVGPWSLRSKTTLAETHLENRILAGLDWKPQFYIAIVVPTNDKTAIGLARRTLASLARQSYANKRILLLPQGRNIKDSIFEAQLLDGFPALADSVEIVKRRGTALGKTLGTQAGIASYVMALQPGDELSCDALVKFAVETGLHRDADFVYADERRVSPISGAIEAFFKPDWSPDLLLSTNYIGRAWCASGTLLARTGMTLDDIIKCGPYDSVLRLTEAAKSIGHISSVLFEGTQSTSEPVEAERSALRNALTRRSIDGVVETSVAPGIFRVKRAVAAEGLVSIIIPTCAAGGLIKTCLDTLRSMTAYRNFEIVCVENIPADQQDWKTWLRANADIVIETTEPFNWSRFNNLAVARSRGEFLLFLNDDIQIVQADWLDTLLEHAQRPEVGVVGPQLLYPDGRVQHAGMFLATMGIARHAFRYLAADDPGYFGLARTQRNVISVTGACLLTRREIFEAVGRFDEMHTIVNNDLDYCLRVWRAGLRTIYTPHTTLIHHEQASRVEMDDVYDTSAFERHWNSLFMAGDPFFNTHLSKERDDYSCEWEPVQLLYSGRPLFDREAIQKILIVKLDHIGDCVTALPAVRRMKRHFPNASFHVLSSRASKSIWALEPAIDEIIEFDFFHARSSLGRVEHSADDWLALSDRLKPYGFDLAVDLRKHIETRSVLLHTGARYLAGYDHKGQFPWLDVALEWNEDQAFFRKRQHAADDLNNLVDAIAAAGEDNNNILVAPPGHLPEMPGASSLFEKPVVCVHPAAGNEMKQWPPQHFAQLINELVDRDGVHVAMVGSPDEEPIASAILANIKCPEAVVSLVGKLELSELPGFIAACALFVGNDSGPKHIAAALGIPTVGIHAGIVDSREWGPIGANAIGIDRDMTCSPCYRSKLEDCHRQLACLRQILPGDVHRACERLLFLDRTFI